MTNLEHPPDPIAQSLLAAVAAERGHFLYESGDHGDLWLDLDRLFLDARRVQGWAAALAERVMRCTPAVICGPLTGGAFVAQAVAAESGLSFVFAARSHAPGGALQYRIPRSVRAVLADQRVLLVDDAINAGSALRLTVADVQACGGQVAGFAALLTLGPAAAELAATHGVPLFALAALERALWPAVDCPLCQAQIPLVDQLHQLPM
jgi:orotate phosphoribosyltransferase